MPDDVFRWVIAIAVVIACIAFLVQAGVVFALYRIVKTVQPKVVSLTGRVEPLVETVRKIADENRPKVLEISTNTAGIVKHVRETVAPRIAEISTEAVAIAKNVRGQVEQVGELVHDATGRARTKIAKLDQTVDETVENVQHVGESVKKTVMKPVKEVNGILSGIKVGVSTFAHGGRRASVDHATQDEEMFI